MSRLVLILADNCGVCVNFKRQKYDKFLESRCQELGVEFVPIYLTEMRSEIPRDLPEGLSKLKVWFPMLMIVHKSGWEKLTNDTPVNDNDVVIYNGYINSMGVPSIERDVNKLMPLDPLYLLNWTKDNLINQLVVKQSVKPSSVIINTKEDNSSAQVEKSFTRPANVCSLKFHPYNIR